MTIKRGARRTGFTVLDNAVFNGNLSFRAMGLLSYLLSKPDHWEVSVQQLVNMSGKTAQPDGRDRIYTIIDELIASGFVRRTRRRGDAGRMNGYEYEVFDTQQPVDVVASNSQPPLPEIPDTAAPDLDSPYTAETTQVKTDLEVKTELEVKTDTRSTAAVAGVVTEKPDTAAKYANVKRIEAGQAKRAAVGKGVRPASVPEALWDDFLALRAAKRAPITATAMTGIEREATKAGITLEAALQMCCERGWQSFRADWCANQAGRSGRAPAGSLGGMNYGDRNGHFD